MTFARTGPPFNFLGTMTEAQKDSLVVWDSERRESLTRVQEFHQVRAAQLRRTAAVLEAFYAQQSTPVTATFKKAPWEPSDRGHFNPSMKNDRLPAIVVSDIKDIYQEQIATFELAEFRMNFVRTQVEAHEDMAQEAHDAPAKLNVRFQELDNCFSDPNYSQVLLRKSDLWAPEGSGLAPEPRHRAHPLDPPTHWERQNAGQALS